MTFFFAKIAIGAVIGALMACIIIFWVKFFVAQLYSAATKNSSNYYLGRYSANIPDWIIIALMTITAGLLAFWRQLSPEFLIGITTMLVAMLGFIFWERGGKIQQIVKQSNKSEDFTVFKQKP